MVSARCVCHPRATNELRMLVVSLVLLGVAQALAIKDEPYPQLYSRRMRFNSTAANWASLPLAPGAVHRVVASSVAAAGHAAAWLQLNDALMLLDIELDYRTLNQSAPQLTPVTSVPVASDAVLDVVRLGSEDVLFLASSSAINACHINSDLAVKCTHASATWGTVFNISCTFSGDGCFVSTTSGLYTVNATGSVPTLSRVSTVEPSPEAVAVFGKSIADSDLVVVATTAHHIWRLDQGKWRREWLESITEKYVHHLAFTADGTCFHGSPDSLYPQYPDGSFVRVGAIKGLPFNETMGMSAPLMADKQALKLWVATGWGVVRVQFPAISTSYILPSGLDYQFSYYNGPRWLPTVPSPGGSTSQAQNTVKSISASDDGSNVWVLTHDGLSCISEFSMTLAQKAEHYREMIPRHDRMGLMADVGLQKWGDLNSFQQHSTDNDGLWTSLNLGGLTFRYQQLGTEEAWQIAWKAFEGMELLNNATGIRGLMARSVLPRDVPYSGGTWHNSSVYPNLKWKGDTSSDEVCGHMFIYPIVLDHLARTPSQQQRARRLILDIASYIVDNHYLLIDITGSPTTWGRWSPEYINDNASWYDERGLNSMQILSWLRSAYRISGNESYIEAMEFLIAHGYHENLVNLKITVPDDDNFSDDELTFLPYFTWIYAELFPLHTPSARAKAAFDAVAPYFRRSVFRTWISVGPERSDLWNVIFSSFLMLNATSTAPAPDLPPTATQKVLTDAAWCLRKWPLEFIYWPWNNKQRMDVWPNPYPNRGNGGDGRKLLPPDERDAGRWNADPYVLTGGSGNTELDPGAWLLPFWMARFFGFIQ